MKTTIELPDDLLIAAKRRAAELKVPLRRLIEEGLRARLAASVRRPVRSRRIRWITVDGGLPPGLDLAPTDCISWSGGKPRGSARRPVVRGKSVSDAVLEGRR